MNYASPSIYLAGFLLTRLLLPLVTVSKPARIVNVSSLAQQPIDFDDVMLTRGYTGGRAYATLQSIEIPRGARGRPGLGPA
jgi:NAD(P)-dependent dehydrogenase (short-subunit alcohol dehydrogenase family)